MRTPVSQYGRVYVKCARSLMQRYQYVTSYSSHLLPLILLTCCQLFVSPDVSHSSRLLSCHYLFFSLVASYSSHLLSVILLTCCQLFFSLVASYSSHLLLFIGLRFKGSGGLGYSPPEISLLVHVWNIIECTWNAHARFTIWPRVRQMRTVVDATLSIRYQLFFSLIASYSSHLLSVILLACCLAIIYSSHLTLTSNAHARVRNVTMFTSH